MSDYLTQLPKNILENILCLVPLEEAARTSILSREWRYTWKRIPKLLVDVDTITQPYADDPMDPVSVEWRQKFLRVVSHLVMSHEGPLTEVKLSLEFEADDNHNGINQVIYAFAKHRANLKKLTVDVYLPNWFTLHLSLVQVLHELTDLKIHRCRLVLQRNDFGKLTSLSLLYIKTSPKTLLGLLDKCPFLKSFTLMMVSDDLSLHNLDDSSVFTDLFKHLSEIQDLTIQFDFIAWFDTVRVPTILSNSLDHLKELCISMGSVDGLYCVGFVLKNSTKMSKLSLEIYDNDGSTEEDYDLLKYCQRLRLEHLSQLVIDGFGLSATDIAFVKLILAKSSALKKVSISYKQTDRDRAMVTSEIFKSAPKKSSSVEISVATRR